MLKIERTTSSEPSFDTADDLEAELKIDRATVIMDHGDSTLVVTQPPVIFLIEDNESDIEKKHVFLEWANCYWNETQRQGGRLRKVTLKFYNDNDECYRSFIIESAFLSRFEEGTGEVGSSERYYKATIRSNAKAQNIEFLPRDIDENKHEWPRLHKAPNSS
jgi:hypothetical protein